MIDFEKILKIKNKKDISKFKINEPLFLSNYLFHYLIMTNNIEGMKIVKHPIYKENNEGLQGFHLSAKVYSETNSMNMLNLLLDKYPEYATNVNYFNETFIDYLPVNDNLLVLMKHYKNINWLKLLTNVSYDDEKKQCYIDKIFKEGSFKLITFVVKYLKKLNFNWDEFVCTSVFEITNNSKVKTNMIIKIIKMIGQEIVFNIIDDEGKSIIYPTIESNNIELIKYFIKKEIDLDKYTSIYTLHPFIHSYIINMNSNSKKKNKYDMSKLIWNNIKNTHNFDSYNKYGENLAFTVMNLRLMSGSGDLELEKDILKRNTIWNNFNIDKENILQILINLPYEDYYKSLNNVKIDFQKKNKENKTITEIATGKWLKFIEKLDPINKEIKEDNLKIGDYEFANSNTFSSTIFDAGIFFIHLNDKYKDLYLPKFLNKTDNNMYWEEGFEFPDNYLFKYNNFPWIIFWKDKYNYHIHPELNQLINANKNNDKYNYSFILLSVLLPHGGLHAMLLYYDFRNNYIERFDPYGNTYDLDKDIDNILEEELTWNTGFNYLNVKKYLPVAGFQNLSDENNILYQKPGDFGGYCLAWCLWYLELRINNYKFTAKQLVKKAIDKLLKKENNFIIFIRNYANTIDKFRMKHIIKAGVDEKNVSNKVFKNEDLNKVIDYVIKNTTIS